jgi:hypothetical protein
VLVVAFRYGSRALELIQRFYEGELADLEADGASDSDQEADKPRAAPTANGSAGCHHEDHMPPHRSRCCTTAL